MFKSIMAGIMISMGCVTFLSCDNKYMGALLFSLGLYTVIRFGYRLYTGRIGFIVSDLHNLPCESDLKSKCKSLVVTYVGNFIGVALTACCVMCTKLGGFINMSQLQQKSMTMAMNKIADTPLSLICLGIGCGICMAVAAYGAKTLKESNITQPVIIIFPVMVFILCGFEHCIADMFYLSFVATSIPVLGALKVILCATIGNTIGGILVGKSIKE